MDGETSTTLPSISQSTEQHCVAVLDNGDIFMAGGQLVRSNAFYVTAMSMNVQLTVQPGHGRSLHLSDVSIYILS